MKPYLWAFPQEFIFLVSPIACLEAPAIFFMAALSTFLLFCFVMMACGCAMRILHSHLRPFKLNVITLRTGVGVPAFRKWCWKLPLGAKKYPSNCAPFPPKNYSPLVANAETKHLCGNTHWIPATGDGGELCFHAPFVWLPGNIRLPTAWYRMLDEVYPWYEPVNIFLYWIIIA